MLQDKSLDKNVPIPLYFQLEKLILEEIENGTYPVGGLIPTEKELSQIFDISRTTVRQAIADLVQKDHLYRVKSKGTFVARPKISQEGFIHTIKSYNDDVREAGCIPSTEVLDMKVIEAPEELVLKAGFPSGSKVIYLHRKRYVNEEPFVRVETFLPYEQCAFVLEHDFTSESLYSVLSERRTTHIMRIVRTCEIRSANTEDVAVLGVKRGRPIHFFASLGYNCDGELIEYSSARYRGDQSKFRVEISRE